MRILHVVEPFSSGITTFITFLVNGMSEDENYVLHGTRVSSDELTNVRGRFEKGTKFIIWNSAVRSVNPIKDLLALIQLVKVISKIKPNIIHLHSSKAGFLGRVAGIFFKTRIIYTPNGLSFARKDISKLKRFFFRFLEISASKFSGRVISCSKSEMELLNSVGVKGDYINNGTIIKPQTEKKTSDTENVITIGCLALITEQKDPLSFNKIANHFTSNDAIKFIWIGDGHLRKYLDSKNIEITGWLDSAEKEENFSKIDIYLSCSLWEGLPFSVLEAMNYSKCLLLRNCVGNIDLVENNVNGFSFDSNEEAISRLEELISDKNKIESFGSASFQKLKNNFDVKMMVSSYRYNYELD